MFFPEIRKSFQDSQKHSRVEQSRTERSLLIVLSLKIDLSLCAKTIVLFARPAVLLSIGNLPPMYFHQRVNTERQESQRAARARQRMPGTPSPVRGIRRAASLRRLIELACALPPVLITRSFGAPFPPHKLTTQPSFLH